MSKKLYELGYNDGVATPEDIAALDVKIASVYEELSNCFTVTDNHDGTYRLRPFMPTVSQVAALASIK